MRFVPILVFAASAAVAHAQDTPLDASSARDKLVELNKTWGKARVAHDRDSMDKMLAKDFFVQIGTTRIGRDDFIDQSAKELMGVLLKRFDVEVLTVQVGSDGTLTAVISEKLEYEGAKPDGQKQSTYSLWITRDKWKRDGDKWLALSSEAIGFEVWNGKKPPSSVWG